LRSYFGLTISASELTRIVAEIATLFGLAYARLLKLIRQQAVLHLGETSWRFDSVLYWLRVFVNNVVVLYVVRSSHSSRVSLALLGPSFDGGGDQRFLQRLFAAGGRKSQMLGVSALHSKHGCTDKNRWK
jgi:hypothetical protein